MSAVEGLPFVSTPFVSVPCLSVEIGSSRFVWAEGGTPAVLDAASSVILDTYAEPMTPKDLAADLEAAVGLDHETAMRSAFNTTYALGTSGLINKVGAEPRPVWSRWYPAGASP